MPCSRINIRMIGALLCLLCLLPYLSFAAGAAGGSDPGLPARNKILVITSYNPDVQRISDFISEFHDSLARDGVKHDIMIGYISCHDISGAGMWGDRLHAILDSCGTEHLDAVVLLGQEAWALFLSQKEFTAEIPFFASYVNESGVLIPSAGERTGSGWTPAPVNMVALADSLGTGGGVLNRYDVKRNVELILSLYPGTENIVFVSDNTLMGVSLQALVRRDMADFPGLDFIFIDSRDGEAKAVETLSSLPANSAMLLGMWRVGDQGQPLLYDFLGRTFHEGVKLPVFSMTGAGIGSVAIGGYIPGYNGWGGLVARQLAGYRNGDRSAVRFISAPQEYRFDRNKLKEFNIAESRLPSGSVIVESADTVIRRYRSVISTGGMVFAVLLVLMAVLVALYCRIMRLKRSLEHREGELIEARDKAREADMLKSAFLANMSHEIRTPLNAIVGFSTLLEDEALTKEDRTEYNDIINKNANLLLALINDILDISKLETGKIRLVLSKVDIAEICRQAVFTTAHSRRDGVECIFVPSDEPFMIVTDMQRLSQVLINLLTNAGKFTREGRITVAYDVDEENGRVVFSVTDTGCGIPPEQMENVFNRFEKLNEFEQGTGLGLAICRQILLKLGGEIRVDPDYTGGARFVFTHPISQDMNGGGVKYLIIR